MLFAVWRKKACFIQFLLKNRALNFRVVFLAHPLFFAPLLILHSDVILKLDQKSPKSLYLVLLVKEGQNS